MPFVALFYAEWDRMHLQSLATRASCGRVSYASATVMLGQYWHSPSNRECLSWRKIHNSVIQGVFYNTNCSNLKVFLKSHKFGWIQVVAAWSPTSCLSHLVAFLNGFGKNLTKTLEMNRSRQALHFELLKSKIHRVVAENETIKKSCCWTACPAAT